MNLFHLPIHPYAEIYPMLTPERLAALADDIRENGQIDEIVIWRGQIIDGRNRLAACRIAGVIPTHEEIDFADESNVLSFVVSKNNRRDLDDSQRAMIGAKLEPLFAEQAKRRQAENARRNQPQADSLKVANLPPIETSKARDEAAAAVNVSPRSIQSAKAVLREGAPELIAQVEQGNVKVSTAETIATLPKAEQAEVVARGEKEILAKAKEIRAERQQERRIERIEKLSGIAAGNAPLSRALTFPILYVDPPWRYEHSASESRAIENQYPTMSLEDICALPVADACTPDAILYLWTTAPKMQEAMDVLKAWGFVYRSQMIWDKETIGMGYWARIQHEILIVATKGTPPTPKPEHRLRSVYREQKAEHSAKPAYFAEMIETAYPELPKLEMFCRSPRPGWAVWGNQSEAK